MKTVNSQSEIWVSILGLLVLGCEVPEVPKVSLYDQGSELHSGLAAQQAAQGVLNHLQLREVRQDVSDFDALTATTRCRLGIYRGEEEETPPTGFLILDIPELDAELCDDLRASDARERAGRAWLQNALPYASDVHAQSMQAEYARNYAHRIRELGIEAEEWSVPDDLQECIGERVTELTLHHANIAQLACQAYQSPSDGDSDAYLSQLVDARERAEQLLEESHKVPPVVEASQWENPALWAEFEATILDLGSNRADIFRYSVSSNEPPMGFPVTLLRGETIAIELEMAQMNQLSEYRLGLWSVEREEWALQGLSELVWTAPRTGIYIVAAEYVLNTPTWWIDRPPSTEVELRVWSDGAGALSESRRSELEQFAASAILLAEAGPEGLVGILRWENDAAQLSCVDAALLDDEDYARHRVVDEALDECTWELRHRIETRARVLQMGSNEGVAEN